MTESAKKAAEFILKKANGLNPKLAITLGSGLGSLVDLLESRIVISYNELPDFPPCTVSGHAGNLVLVKLNGFDVACLQGRAHFYEDISNIVAKTYVRTMRLIGCDTFFITNAAGSMRNDIFPGDLVVIKDHINFQFQNVLVGPNDAEFGPRFIGMEDIYDHNLRRQLFQAASQINMSLHEGVYFAVLGPNFETPAEIRAFKMLGGDVVAMSAINESVIAHHCGMKVMMISAVTNMAAGMSDIKLSHEVTLEGAIKGAEKLKKIILEFVKNNY